MNDRDLARAWEIVSAALDVPAAARRDYVRAECGAGDDLLAEVESLLRHVDAELARTPQTAAPAGVPQLPDRIGGFELVRKIGEGAMGVVYEATQRSPHRRVALKLLHRGLHSEAMQRRFEHEADLLAGLQHPGIVQIHATGAVEFAGARLHYFAMELVDGRRLDDFLATARLGLRQQIELLAQICDAAHHAHQKGVLHRDLKPENVLVTDDGRPKVLDFGVARATDGDAAATLTVHGQVVGTLDYMSPEQATGQRDRVTVGSDVWSLGVIGYQMLTGRLPFSLPGSSVAEAARRLAEDEPVPPGRIDRALRGDLETVLGKAIAKDPAQRYHSAAEFAADLRRVLANEPVVARAPTALYQLRRFARRNRGLCAGALIAAAALAAGVVGVAHFAVDAAWQERVATTRAYRMSIAAANEASGNDRFHRAASLLEQAPEELRGWEWHYVRARLQPWSRRLEVATRGAVAWTPDGLALLAAGADGGVVRIDDADHQTRPYACPDPATTVAVDPNGDGAWPRLAVGTATGRVFVWAGDPTAAPAVLEHGLPDADPAVRSLVWTGRGELLGATGTVVARWNPRTGACRDARRWAGTYQLQVNRGGDRLAMVRHQTVALIDLTAGLDHERFVYGTPKEPQAAAFAAGDHRLLVSTHYQTIHVLDADTGERLDQVTDHQLDNAAIGVSADDRWLAMTSRTGELMLYDPGSLRRTAVLPCGSGPGRIAFRPDARAIAYADDTTLTVVDLPLGADDAIPTDIAVERLSWSADGQLLAASDKMATRVWDTTARDLLAELDGEVVDFQTGERLLLRETRRPDGAELSFTDTVVDFGTGARERQPAPPSRAPYPFSARRHGEYFREATAANGDWTPLSASRELGWLRRDGDDAQFPGNVYSAVFLADGARLLLGTADGAEIWRRAPLQRLQVTAAGVHADRVLAVAIDPTGRRIATGSRDNVVRLFDAQSLELLLELEGHRSHVSAVAFSPDGRRLASGSGDRTIRIWDTEPVAERARRRRELRAAMAQCRPQAAALLHGGVDRVAERLAEDRGLSPLQRLALRRVVVPQLLRR